jgi:hypothetical protein
MPGWWAPDDDNDGPVDVPQLEVEDRPNPVVGVLLGPDGWPLVELLERAMGFHPGPREPSRTVRAEGW